VKDHVDHHNRRFGDVFGAAENKQFFNRHTAPLTQFVLRPWKDLPSKSRFKCHTWSKTS
jgi:hypothetical protein